MSYEEKRNPFFDIIREPVRTSSGITVPNKNALINAETKNVLGLVSPTYNLITNQEVNDLFNEALKGFSISHTIDHLDADTKRWKRQIIFSDLNSEIEEDDPVGMMLEIFNGFTGRTSFGYNLMGYRWLCANGIVMGKKELFSESFAHYIDSPEQLRTSFEMKFDAYKENVDVWKSWTEIPFGWDEFNQLIEFSEYVTPKVGEAILTDYSKMVTEMNWNENLWGAFNILTAIATHNTVARKGSNIFSNRYNTVNRLATDLYRWEREISDV